MGANVQKKRGALKKNKGKGKADRGGAIRRDRLKKGKRKGGREKGDRVFESARKREVSEERQSRKG